MASIKWWCAAWVCWLSQAANAVGITPQMLDVERNPVESIAAAQAAIDALPTLGLEAEQKRLEWLLQATFAAAMLGDQPAYTRYAASAGALGVQLNDPYAKALLKALSAGKAGEAGKPQEAIAGAREAVQLAEAVVDPLSRAFVRDMIGWALMIGRQFGEAEGHLRAAIEAYVAHGAVLRRSAAQAGMGALFDGLRDSRSAYRERQAAYDLIRDLDAPYLKSYLTWSLGKDALLAGEAQKAKDHFETSVRESARMNDRAGVGSAAEQGMGLAAADLGQWQQALKVLESVQPRMLSKGYIPLWVVGQAALARAQVELGRGDGEAALAPARQKLQALGDGTAMIQFLEREAGVMRASGRPGRAADLLADALAMERRLYSDTRQAQLSELAVRYDVYKKQVENTELRAQKELVEARISQQATRQQLMLTVLLLGSVAVGLLAWTLRQQVRSRRHFSELAATDVLTGAPNRRSILEQLEVLLVANRPGLVCVLDIDHFKHINDQHGHPVGDRVLQDFYQACTAGAVAGERVGRLGGEEWLLVMEGVGPTALQPLFDRIREQFHRRARHTLSAGPLPTFSMGACPLQSGRNVSEMLAEADLALYQAKEAGRDGWALRQTAPTK